MTLQIKFTAAAILSLALAGFVYAQGAGEAHVSLQAENLNDDPNRTLSGKRTITGTVFIDRNGDGRYSESVDEAVAGAYVTINGNAVITDEDGVYIFKNVKAAKTELIVMSARGMECEPVVVNFENRKAARGRVNISIRP